MKKIFAGLVVLAMTVTTIQAQDPQRKMDRMKRGQGMMMHQRSNLTEEQKQKFKALNEDFRKKMTDLRKQDEITVKEWRSRMAELQKKHHTEMQNVLSPEQKARLEKAGRGRFQKAGRFQEGRLQKRRL